jgi:hypothetical protein
MIGKPYAIHNGHCNLSFRGHNCEQESPRSFDAFIAHMSQITGRVVDHLMKFNSNQGNQLEELIVVDEELVNFAARMPADFWEPEIIPLDFTNNVDDAIRWREGVLKVTTYISIPTPSLT